MKQNQMHIKVYYKCKRQKTKATLFMMKALGSMIVVAILMLAGSLFPTSTIGVLAGNMEEVSEKDNFGTGNVINAVLNEERLLNKNYSMLTYNKGELFKSSFNDGRSLPDVGAEEVMSEDLAPILSTVPAEREVKQNKINRKVGDENGQNTNVTEIIRGDRGSVTQEKKKKYEFESNDEYENFCRVVEAEVTGDFKNHPNITYQEGLECKIRVAQVILHRVEDEKFPDTVNEVIFQKNQFTPVLDGRFYSVKVTDTTRKAIELALDTSYPDLVTDGGETALYFSSGTTYCAYGEHMFTDPVNQSFFSPDDN